MQANGADFAAVEFALGDYDALADDALGLGLELPVKVHVGSDDSIENVLVMGAHDDAQHVVLADDGLALRNLDVAVLALHSRDREIVVNDGMQARHGNVIDKLVGHLIGDDVGLELAGLLLTLNVLDLLVNVDFEDDFEEYH